MRTKIQTSGSPAFSSHFDPRRYCFERGIDYRVYAAWVDMRNRCKNRRHKRYKDYGGRGIRVSPRWDSFEQFALDMGPHPGRGWSLDRIDNNGPYAEWNCRWATIHEQMRNRHNVLLSEQEAEDIRRRYRKGWGAKLATEYGVSKSLVYMIVRGERWKKVS